MAHDIQLISAGIELRGLKFNVVRQPYEPRGQAIFRADSATVAAIGAGDTGALRLEFVLPSGFLFVLTRFMATLRGDDIDDWNTPAFRYYWSPLIQEDPGFTVQIDQPVSQQTSAPPEGASALTYNFYCWGGGDREGKAVTVATNQVSRSGMSNMMPIFGGYGAGVSPEFTMRNGTADSAIASLSYICIFNVFDVEDILESTFHSNSSNLITL